jgi:uncharacterized membrane protein YdbT with pleckstrin-like domain
MGFPKKLLGDDESLVMVLRPHVKRLIGPVVLLLVVSPLATFVAGLVPDGAAQPWLRGAVALAAVLVLLRWALWPFVVWWNTVYVITDRRLVMRHGVFSRSGHDMPLTRLNDVSFSHNMIERMLGCGTLTVESAGERGQVVLSDVPKVEQVQRTLYRLSDDARDGTGGARRIRADLDGGADDAVRGRSSGDLPDDLDPGR